MFTVTTHFSHIAESRSLTEILRRILRSIDPEYVHEENIFCTNVHTLKSTLTPDAAVFVDNLLAAQEDRMTAALLYLFRKGLRQNAACFRNAANKRFLDLDFEDIHQESNIHTLPEAQQVFVCTQALYRILSEEQEELADSIASCYCHLETVGFKLVHYWGFRHGDDLFPWVISGYTPDVVLTAAYRQMLTDYLGFDPEWG